MKPIKYKATIKTNPKWKAQLAVIKKEIAKLSKMEAYTITFDEKK